MILDRSLHENESTTNQEGSASRSARTCLPYTQGRPDIPGYLARFARTDGSHAASAFASAPGANGFRASSADSSCGEDNRCGSSIGDPAPRGIEGVDRNEHVRQGGRGNHDGKKRGRAMVFACGPSQLIEEAFRAALAAGMEFHSEAFEL